VVTAIYVASYLGLSLVDLLLDVLVDLAHRRTPLAQQREAGDASGQR
jgi:hypothetical protein